MCAKPKMAHLPICTTTNEVRVRDITTTLLVEGLEIDVVLLEDREGYF
jgi:hypothetical protein